MRIYMFRSQPKPELRAFANDEIGSSLPERFGPWLITGVITEEKKPPFQLPREAIEEAIKTQGFQLWRMKTAPPTPVGGA